MDRLTLNITGPSRIKMVERCKQHPGNNSYIKSIFVKTKRIKLIFGVIIVSIVAFPYEFSIWKHPYELYTIITEHANVLSCYADAKMYNGLLRNQEKNISQCILLVYPKRRISIMNYNCTAALSVSLLYAYFQNPLFLNYQNIHNLGI